MRIETFPARDAVRVAIAGVGNFLIENVDGMASALCAADTLDRDACFDAAQSRFPLSRMIDAYFALYAELNAAAQSRRAAGAA
jgi:hypothetical protein